MADREVSTEVRSYDDIEVFKVNPDGNGSVPVVVSSLIDGYNFVASEKMEELEEKQLILIEAANQGLKELWSFEEFEKEQINRLGIEKLDITHAFALKINALYSEDDMPDSQIIEDINNLEDQLAIELLKCDNKYNQIIDLKLISIAYKLMPLASLPNSALIELNPKVEDIFWNKASLVFTPERTHGLYTRRTDEDIVYLFKDVDLNKLIRLSTDINSTNDDIEKRNIDKQSLDKVKPENKQERLFFLLIDLLSTNGNGLIDLMPLKSTYQINPETPQSVIDTLRAFQIFADESLYSWTTQKPFDILIDFQDYLAQAAYTLALISQRQLQEL